ncbi:alcohol dehydrogenase catalytic domain-containing protein [Bradyrhizobium sp. NP1]|uniref:zinc-dependent alcohol dehydrogenase n=1 Tax=Bradyrhizobium sp. NP1 TaxID=3049772 RepID=UPI0025A62EA8|nr:alcohol dehydrogenase catalytic domain-containing protein [Bradyrhizobium sp. NP1]WJR80870.1 alcohol dehydrogenase catalytic domain-containing protein [Bradyrhizobium sp. NP1]
MRALVYTGPNALELREESDPVPLADEVLVKVEAVGICGSDMHAYHGHDSRRPPPLILGHEAAGRVLTGPRTGERVTINPLVVDPTCPYAIAGRWHLSPTRQILSMPPRPGAFAEYVRVPERNLEHIPDALPIEHAALAEPIAVSWHAVRLGMERLLAPAASACTVILGGGAIGLTAAIVARHFGATDLRVGETNPLRRDMLHRAEGIETYAPGGPSEPDESSVDLVIDAVGALASRAAASRMVRPGGVIVHLGLLPGADGLDIRKVTLQEITFTGSYCYTPMDFKQTVAAIAGGRLGKLRWFEERTLSDGARAFASIDAGAVAAAKVVLRP